MKHFTKIILFYAVVLVSLFYGCKNDKLQKTTVKFFEQQIDIPIDSVKISSTLLLPDSNGTFPLVIIVAGSGPTDRNGNNTLGVKAGAYKLLADSLVNYGIATFRYDKRGIAKSQANVSEFNLRFDTYVNDLSAIIDYLKKDKRFSKIIVLGHSEGALIGAIAAQSNNVDKYISVSGVSRPANEILMEQLIRIKEVDTIEIKHAIAELLKGNIVELKNTYLKQIFRISVEPYLISWFKYNPIKIYSELEIPILIIHGTTDIQVPVSDAKRLADSAKNSKLVIVQGMNHVLKDAPADTLKNKATYLDANLPLNKQFVREIVDFVKQ